MSIYTKRGDRGQTDLFDLNTSKKIRIYKDDVRLKIIGSIDEVNSYLGVVTSLSNDRKEISFIRKIQKDLFLINSLIAGLKGISFSKNKVNYLEKKIDLLEKKLPKLTNFILPGGSNLSAFYHLARSVTRRAERNLVSYCKNNHINPNILIFVNRLSDLLFVLARWSNKTSKVDDLVWKN